jgi:predicted esterase/chitodextrinase
MRRIVGLWVMFTWWALVPVFSQVDTSYIYNTAMPYGTVDLRISKSATRYYYLQEDITFSYRESAPGVKTNTYLDMTSWDSSPYRQGNLREKNGAQDLFVMNYRILFPENYNPNLDPGYPIILMLHGYGERGNCWFDNCYWSTTGWNPNTNSPPAPTTSTHVLLNNDHNLLHGGNPHLSAVRRAGSKHPDDPTLAQNAFPGIVLFPQAMNGWQQTSRVEEAIKLLRLIIKKYNIDENRVYIHGLSNGGGGVFHAIKRAPWLFAAALGMSAVSNGGIYADGLAPEVGKIPMWVFQGGKDTNPTPSRTYLMVKQFREAGASIRYSYYPNLGHGTWNTAYNEKDFFSWIREKRKNQPHIFYGNPVICNTNGAGVRIGFSKGFFAYQWEQDGVIVPGANASEFVANTPGAVRGRFSRKPNPTEADWEPWSEPIIVTEISPAKPTIETPGSTHLRGPGLVSAPENNTVVFKSNTEAELYTWYKNGVPVEFAGTDVHDTLRTASITSAGAGANGAYTLKTSFSYCPSPPSDPVYVFFNNSAPQNMTIDKTAAAFSAKIVESGVLLSWNDVVSKESGYEIWRKKSTDANFTFAGRAPKDALSFYDKRLQPSTTYFYKLRAVGNTGVSNYLPSNVLTENVEITTPADHETPLAPQELRIITNTLNSITLSWKASEDNAAIKNYIIELGTSSVDTDSSLTTFTLTGLTPNTIYPITVKAVDYSGLVSAASNQVVGSTFVLGLRYNHSTGAWEDLDDPLMIATWSDPEFTGTINNFLLTPRTQEDFFNFQFKGYLDIPATGQYMFRLSSGDGSRLLIDDSIKIDNDGIHGTVTRFSDTLTLTQGPHPIEVQFFDYSGSQSLTVQYKNLATTLPYRAIPDSLLRSGKYTPPPVPAVPTGLTATANGMERIDLAWNNSGEQVEIYRSTAQDGTFSILGKASTGIFVDTIQALPGKTYFYKARTLSPSAVSNFSAVVSATTATDLVPPSVPTGVTITNKSHTVAAISWNASTDNTEVMHYEILVNGVIVGTSDIPAFMVTDLLPNTTYTLTVVAVDANNNKSAASAALIITTNPSAMYYSLATGNLNDPATWRQNPDGTGASPVDFTENGQYFMISNRTVTTTGGPWDVSGSASKVVVPAGVTLTIDQEFLGKLEIEGNAVVYLNHTATPELQKISAESSVHFNAATFVPAKTYGNLFLDGTGIKTFEEGMITVLGNLSIQDGLALHGASGNASMLTVGGNVLINGMQGFTAPDNRVGLTFTANNSHTITSNGDLLFYAFVLNDNSNVTISTPTPKRLILGSLNGGGLTTSTGSVLTLASNSLQTIGASSINTLNQSGKISIAGGDLKIRTSGTDASHIYLDAVSHLVDTLQIEGGTTTLFMHSPVDIRSSIILKSGTLNSAGNIRLLSDASGSATIGEITGGAITGEVKVQHYISPVGTTAIEMSTSVDGVTVSEWQTFFPITGPFTGSSGSSESSMFISNGESLVGYPSAGMTNAAAIEKGKGYSTKISGSPITIEVAGTPFQGNTSLPLVAGSTMSNGKNLVGNPFVSPIYWRGDVSWIRTGVGNTIALKENKVVNGQAVGQYQYHSALLGQAEIKAGQAFWVHAFTASPSLVVTEKAKSPISTDSLMYSHLVISLNQGSLADKTYIIFKDDATDNIDLAYDFAKKPNEGMFNLSTINGGEVLAVNTLPNSFCSKDLNLNIQNASVGTYELHFDGLETLDEIGTVTLTDHFLNKTVTVTSAPYSFQITAAVNSFGANRFSLSFARTQLNIGTPVVQGSQVCSEDVAVVTVLNPQIGVNYIVINGQNEELTTGDIAGDENLTIQIPVTKLDSGVNHIQIKAGFPGCTSQLLTSETDVHYIPNFEITVQDDISVCLGDQATLNASGVPAGGQYRWLDGTGTIIAGETDGSLLISPVGSETSYQVMGILSNGCESSVQTIHVYADTLDVPVVTLHNDTLVTQVSASFQWFRNGEPISGATQGYYVPEESGSYTVVASSSGCAKESEVWEYFVDPGCQVDMYTPAVTAENICSHGDATITINNSQAGVTYSAINGSGETISGAIVGNGGTITLNVGSEALDSGRNELTIRADMQGCVDRTLNSKAVFNYFPVFELTSADTVWVCSGMETLLTVSGGPDGATYKWEDEDGVIITTGNSTSLMLGTVTEDKIYYVTGISTSACESGRLKIVVMRAFPELPVVSVVENNLSVSTEGTYQWKLNGVAIQNATANLFTPVVSGSYSVVVSKGDCSVESLPIDYLITGIADGIASEFVLNTYPVPASTQNLTIRVQSPSPEKVLIRIMDMTGRSLYLRWFSAAELGDGLPVNRDSTPFKDGIYYIIATQGHQEIRKKIVVRN